MTASGWLYPDGTRCQSVGSTIQYGVKTVQLCLSGKCQVLTKFNFHTRECQLTTPILHRIFLAIVIQPINYILPCVDRRSLRNPTSSMTIPIQYRKSCQSSTMISPIIQSVLDIPRTSNTSLRCLYTHKHRQPSPRLQCQARIIHRQSSKVSVGGVSGK